MKRTISFFLILIIAFSFLCGCEKENSDGIQIVALNFPAYDFAKNIIGENGSVSLLLPPGGDSHTYEPTAKDIVKISECDIFIYTGGESDTWADDILASLEEPPKTIKMMDCIEVCHEEHDSFGHNHEIDEHIWTSLKNSQKIISEICNEICEYDPSNKAEYMQNAKDYILEIANLDRDFEVLFNNAKRKTIVVADRFPFSYFASDYNLAYYSAYHSCTEDSEPTPAVIGRLVDTVKSEKIPIIFHIEFSNKRIASAVSEDTGAKILELHSCHSVTKQQLDNGTTYVDLMRKNYEAIREAVN